MDEIFAIWESAAAMARDIGEKPVTVRAWRNRGSIPANRDIAIVAAASRRGASLTIDKLAAIRCARTMAGDL